jgi:DNA-binding CsgD family transcriptional regulator
MNPIAEDILRHYGTPRRSGRYPWGSGENPYQHSGDFLSRISELKSQGLSDTEIAKSMGLNTTEYRTQKTLAKDERRSLDVATAKGLREKGYSLKEIADKMGFANDSSVRSLLNENSEARMNQSKMTAEFLKKQVEEKGMIDVGVGVERELGISREKMKEALYILERDGYEVYGGGVPQVTNPGKQTNIQVLCPPGTPHKDIYQFDKIHSVGDYISHDDGQTFDTFVYPKSMDGNRVKIRYAEQGGVNKDGVIEIRRNVDDLSLGDSHYAQVRILVDGNRYLKGMAVYSDDMPDGVDVIFNTNKNVGTPKGDVLKKIGADPSNPFGSLIKAGGQSYYIDKDGNKQLSLINKRAEEGDWGEWSDKLPSQFLAKQNISLIKKQLNLASADKQAEFDEIMSLTNPTVKKALLKSFSDDCDSAAEHLQAAALPRQKYQVILPISSMKDNEVYAPNYKNGEQVALIRYPHGGTFEIPILTVNNKQAEARKVLGTSPIDAVGINKKVADRLSGADFDGDTVMIIPTGGKIKISSTPPLKGLEGFDPKMDYPYRSGMKTMKNTQTEMGKISNLIIDMTLKGATQDELARAVRHSMVVIDAEKHKLDYKQSAIDNGIDSLTKKYKTRIDENGNTRTGASTLLSRAKGEISVTKRQGSPIINPETGEQSWKTLDNPTYTDKKGNLKTRTQQSTQMAETKDAYTLSSGTPQEEAYAEYANKMKSLANKARKEMVSTGKIPFSSTAKNTYQREVDSLNAQLNVALKNAPRERQAQVIANATVEGIRQSNPDMTKGELKKVKQQALTEARNSVGAKRTPIVVTDKEWEAIQAGAVSENTLTKILNNVDIDELKQRSMPRSTTSLSSAKIAKINAMNNSGYSTSEIAEALGVSSQTIGKYLK